MTEKLSDVMTREFGSFDQSPDWQAELEAWKSALDEQALEYLHKRFPDLNDEVFFTDYRGVKHEHIPDAGSVCNVVTYERVCKNCNGNQCLLPESFRRPNFRPYVNVMPNIDGVLYLSLGWGLPTNCNNTSANGEFSRLFAQSGLTDTQLHMTFANFEKSSETEQARRKAMTAARENSCLILAGSAGAGKTHLAVAIAIYAMKSGKQAIFRLVSELVDELRKANSVNSSDYYQLMRQYKEVPCLVLDDMGKERTTRAELDYVYQIVDYRYRANLQTILTTNAKDSDELGRWGDPEYIVPMISRRRGRGSWVTISGTNDYRQKGDMRHAG